MCVCVCKKRVPIASPGRFGLGLSFLPQSPGLSRISRRGTLCVLLHSPIHGVLNGDVAGGHAGRLQHRVVPRPAPALALAVAGLRGTRTVAVRRAPEGGRLAFVGSAVRPAVGGPEQRLRVIFRFRRFHWEIQVSLTDLGDTGLGRGFGQEAAAGGPRAGRRVSEGRQRRRGAGPQSDDGAPRVERILGFRFFRLQGGGLG